MESFKNTKFDSSCFEDLDEVHHSSAGKLPEGCRLEKDMVIDDDPSLMIMNNDPQLFGREMKNQLVYKEKSF